MALPPRPCCLRPSPQKNRLNEMSNPASRFLLGPSACCNLLQRKFLMTLPSTMAPAWPRPERTSKAQNSKQAHRRARDVSNQLPSKGRASRLLMQSPTCETSSQVMVGRLSFAKDLLTLRPQILLRRLADLPSLFLIFFECGVTSLINLTRSRVS